MEANDAKPCQAGVGTGKKNGGRKFMLPSELKVRTGFGCVLLERRVNRMGNVEIAKENK